MSSNQSPILSILIPTFNRARYLDCLLTELEKSISELKYSYEILIGDNASTDHTSDIVKQHNNNLIIEYFRNSRDIGGAKNLRQLIDRSAGRYVLYLADDDLLIVDSLRKHIYFLESNENIGAVYSPWFIYDRLANKDMLTFYQHTESFEIKRGNHQHALQLILDHHIFPEIYIYRNELLKKIHVDDSKISYSYFNQIARTIDFSSIHFSKIPFYRSVVNYFIDDDRVQAGHQQVKYSWDTYRGGLEYILSRFSNQLSAADRDFFQRKIQLFVMTRMETGLRLRVQENEGWIDNYYLMKRLRSFQPDASLTIPEELFRINAMLEFLQNMSRSTPEFRHFAFFEDDPPKVLHYAEKFLGLKFQKLRNDVAEIPRGIILITSSVMRPDSDSAICFNEIDLLGMFP